MIEDDTTDGLSVFVFALCDRNKGYLLLFKYNLKSNLQTRIDSCSFGSIAREMSPRAKPHLPWCWCVILTCEFSMCFVWHRIAIVLKWRFILSDQWSRERTRDTERERESGEKVSERRQESRETTLKKLKYNRELSKHTWAFRSS